MDVFLVPIGGGRHELYCEAPVEHLGAASGSPEAPPAWWRRPLDRFRHVLAQAEEERHRRERGEVVESRGLWRWAMRKVAESVA